MSPPNVGGPKGWCREHVGPPVFTLTTEDVVHIIKSRKTIGYLNNQRVFNPPKLYSTKKDSQEDHVFTAKQLKRQMDLFFDFKPKDAII